MTINCKTVVECYPLSRSKLYEDVLDKKYGDIHKIWITPGHIFITVKEGRQLFTFDNKSTSRTVNNDFEGCLDVKELETPILDVLVSATNYSVVYIVEVSGYVHCWKYKAELWTFLLTFDLCNVNQTTIVSICLHPSQNALFWCEKRVSGVDSQPIYNICKRQLPDDEEKLKNRDVGSLVSVMSNCPSCELYPATSGLYIVVRNKFPMVSMVILWLNYSNKIVVSIGKQKAEITDFSLNKAIEFNRLAIKIAGYICQVKPTEHLEGTVYKFQDMNLSAILKDGSVVTLPENGENKIRELRLDSEDISGNWFECQKVIGSLYNSRINIYKKEEEDTKYEQFEIKSPDGSPMLGFCKLCHGIVWPAFYTENNIYTLQWSVKVEKHTVDMMVKSGNFQTSAVELASLEQQKSDSPSPGVYRDLTRLRQEYVLNEDKKPATKLALLLEPYLKSYWELDKLQQGFLTQNSRLPHLTCRSIEEEVMHTISPQTLMSMSARQSWLLILSNNFPHQVLKVLTSLMDFDTDDISTFQIQRWQCILASENTVSAVSSDVAVPLFEHICRLMLLIQPQKLVHFVKLCQMINNQKVGVSAFIRKRQALQYYDRALDCLPLPKSSEDPDNAVTAYVELLMASEKSNCESMSLRMYIDHGHWKDCLDLVQKYKENQTLYTNLYLILFREMSQREVLSEYAEEMFSASPEISCFTQISSFLTPKQAASAKDVFANSSCDIPIHLIRSSLLKFCKLKS